MSARTPSTAAAAACSRRPRRARTLVALLIPVTAVTGALAVVLAGPAAAVDDLIRRHAGGYALTQFVQYYLLHLYLSLWLKLLGGGRPRTYQA